MAEEESGEEGVEPVDGVQRAKVPPSRRDFLRYGGVAAAGAVAGGAAGAAIGLSVGPPAASPGEPTGLPTLGPTPPADGSPGFAHLVVLMGENRSFDNLLGWLYTPDDPPPSGGAFEGLAYAPHRNSLPDGRSFEAHVYTGATDRVMQSPDPDPGEEFPHVNTQLFGTIEPPANEGVGVGEMASPYNAPGPGASASMSGFARDYAAHLAQTHKREPTDDEIAVIMGGFSPQMLPVLSSLARGFAVYDHWFCAVPSQTFCNRSFFHASMSHGFVTNRYNGDFKKWLDVKPASTIFDRLEAAGLDWRIYFDDLQLISLTGLIHAPALEKYWKTPHFAPMSQFFQDVAAGALPAYTFIEPRMIYDHNDFHPPFGRLEGSDIEGQMVYDDAISDVRAGEALVSSVYEAIRASATEGGSNAFNTMLLITFDEHGGTYDHVPPPAATPPHPDAKPGEMGFSFDRLGCRVPAIAISAYTGAGTVIQDEMHHAAVVSTLTNLHALEPLTARDDGARDLGGAVNLTAPRHPSTWPSPTPQYVPPNPEAGRPHPADAHGDRPLSPPAKGLLGILIAKYGDGGDPEPETYADAYEALQKYGQGLFGVG
ncbi:hypothetical protein ET445_11170 [Agromyces protaetiae]|uniref:phospholipase C n=1 Tax=Agromyces protaetiae TaxID=2509455 RepID=A0A4P6FFG5_9MICO|nr:alkaline phosphatase family protein [Agromyces protaetiae]QAY73823.1 hypothetical protein ET445_11170 [Agromyces protaetiae]